MITISFEMEHERSRWAKERRRERVMVMKGAKPHPMAVNREGGGGRIIIKRKIQVKMAAKKYFYNTTISSQTDYLLAQCEIRKCYSSSLRENICYFF